MPFVGAKVTDFFQIVKKLPKNLVGYWKISTFATDKFQKQNRHV